MTKKDYELIASVLNGAYQDAANGTEEDLIFMLESVIKPMADELGDTNPRFDRKRFIEACTGEAFNDEAN